jgi:hypothetical protein
LDISEVLVGRAEIVLEIVIRNDPEKAAMARPVVRARVGAWRRLQPSVGQAERGDGGPGMRDDIFLRNVLDIDFRVKSATTLSSGQWGAPRSGEYP